MAIEHSIRLECGCRITLMQTASVCMRHALALDDLKRQNDESYAEMIRAMSAATCEVCTPKRKCRDHGAALTSNDD